MELIAISKHPVPIFNRLYQVKLLKTWVIDLENYTTTAQLLAAWAVLQCIAALSQNTGNQIDGDLEGFVLDPLLSRLFEGALCIKEPDSLNSNFVTGQAFRSHYVLREMLG